MNTNHTTLKFFDFNCSPQDITERLGLQPTETGIKGEKFFIGVDDKKIEKIWPHNYWEYRLNTETDEWISLQVDSFIKEIIKPRVPLIKQITKICKSEFSVLQYIYDSPNPGLHFDQEIIKILFEIGVELDVDIYCLSKLAD